MGLIADISTARDLSASRGRSTRVRNDLQRHLPRRSIDGQEEEDGPPQPDPEIDEHGRYRYDEDEVENADEVEVENADEQENDRPHSRATSATRRRKRGARKGKGSSSANVSVNGSTTNISSIMQTSPTPVGLGFEEEIYGLDRDHLDDMAVKSQLLARELSKTSTGWVSSSTSLAGKSTVSLSTSLGNNKENIGSNQVVDGPGEKQVTPKKSKWRMLQFSSSSNSSNSNSDVPPVPVVPNLAGSSQVPSLYSYPYTPTSPRRATKSTGTSTSAAKSDVLSVAGVSVTSGSAASIASTTGRSRSKSNSGSATGSATSHGTASVNAANVASLVMGLGPAPRHTSSTNTTPSGPPPPAKLTASSVSSLHLPASIGSSVHGSSISLDRDERLRGRSERAKQAAAVIYPGPITPPTSWAPNPRLEPVPHPPPRKDRDREHERRNLSPPNSSGPPSSASWRNSMSGASSSTSTTASSSAFTRYSNSSVKSVDTLATSHSGSSSNWRTKAEFDGSSGNSKRAGGNGSSASVNSGAGASGRVDRPVPSNVKSES